MEAPGVKPELFLATLAEFHEKLKCDPWVCILQQTGDKAVYVHEKDISDVTVGLRGDGDAAKLRNQCNTFFREGKGIVMIKDKSGKAACITIGKETLVAATLHAQNLACNARVFEVE